ncbi:MAG: AraC family transcriptional regulator [Mediterranea sp.]|nr:AraC family transcriptional regulator [Mediterranea sp.]
MAGKPYASYIARLYDAELELDKARPDEWSRMIHQLHEAGKYDLNLELEAELLEIEYEREVKGEPADTYMGKLGELAAIAESAEHTYIQLRILFVIFDTYKSVRQDFERAVEVAERIVSVSDKLSVQEFPYILYYYAEIGELCWLLGYHDEMVALMKRVMQDPLAAHEARALAMAYNYTGLYYLNQKRYNDAEHMFHMIRHRRYIAGTDTEFHDEWDAIAEGNIGYVYFKRGDYARSIPYLKTGVRSAEWKGRGFYAACKFATALGDAYLNLDRLDSVPYYIGLANHYNSISPFGKHKVEILLLTSEYDFIVGRREEGRMALDSALEASYSFYEEYNPNREKRFRQTVKSPKNEGGTTWSVAALCLLVLSVAAFLVWLYSRRRGERQVPDPRNEETDRILFLQIREYMETEKPYLRSDFTIKTMSRDLQVNRSYLSAAINNNARCNFRTFVNSYRLRAAIVLLDKNEKNNLSVEAIADEAGFSDRFRFYRVFKEVTGESPMHYLRRKNNTGD